MKAHFVSDGRYLENELPSLTWRYQACVARFTRYVSITADKSTAQCQGQAEYRHRAVGTSPLQIE